MKNLILVLSIILFCWIGLGQSAEQRIKIIFDCDLGSDIDDAFALALILSSPEFDVLGITLDHGLTQERARIACKMLQLTGKTDIPVAVGRQTPLVAGVDRDLAPYDPQYYWAKGFDALKPIVTPAADFIIETLKKYPQQVILITVGPVPNIVDVMKKDPGALKLAKHVYSMFGSFYLGYGNNPVPDAEWNVRADIPASKVFVNSGAKITYAGLDITTFVRLEQANRARLLLRQTPLTNALCGLYSLWGHETPVLYDAVAVGMVLWPELFETRPAHVQVIEGGYTVIIEGKEPNALVGMKIQQEKFLKLFMERLMQQNLGE